MTVELDNGPAKFRATAVQHYFRHPDSQQQQGADVPQAPQAEANNDGIEVAKPFENPEPERPRKAPVADQQHAAATHQRRQRISPPVPFLGSSLLSSSLLSNQHANLFLSPKERAALDLAVKSRTEKKNHRRWPTV
ncbi:hypothetical protein HIM_07867 [Hirsutella minnesotensis 3608]|uniref:Uncharacterized protein n=1 Tax=Hirsutella minnesotensis 3608 TaxID=1043627 RepID=A0A0F7ZMV8_9HYPO|nr:hypothetical protein HIM_07867 [Hirsutella minnesotensis 3608]